MYCKWERNRWKKYQFIPEPKSMSWEDLMGLGYKRFVIEKEDLGPDEIHDQGSHIVGADTVTLKFSAIPKPELTDDELDEVDSAKNREIFVLLKNVMQVSMMHNDTDATFCSKIRANLKKLYENREDLGISKKKKCAGFLREMYRYFDNITLDSSNKFNKFADCKTVNEMIDIIEN